MEPSRNRLVAPQFLDLYGDELRGSGLHYNLQVTRELHFAGFGELQLYGAAKNLFDYVQPSPLIDPADPFGDAFDTTYVYGPIRGRNVGFGARLIVL